MPKVSYKGFCFHVKRKRWYMLMKRISYKGGVKCGRLFMGDSTHHIPTPEEGLDSSYYLVRIKNKPGTHQPNFPEEPKTVLY